MNHFLRGFTDELEKVGAPNSLIFAEAMTPVLAGMGALAGAVGRVATTKDTLVGDPARPISLRDTLRWGATGAAVGGGLGAMDWANQLRKRVAEGKISRENVKLFLPVAAKVLGIPAAALVVRHLLRARDPAEAQ